MDSQEETQKTNLVLAHKRFLLTHPDVQDIDKVRLKEEVFSMVKADDMAWFYETLVAESVLEMDQSVIDSMRTKMSSRKLMRRKLHCKIDKVAGVLETNRPDAKNALYQATFKQGDFLLNRIQKLSRVIDL